MKKLSILMLSMSLVACGGGSGDTESKSSSNTQQSSASNVSYPLNKAFQNIYTKKGIYSLSTDTGYVLKLNINPIADEAYKEKTYKVAELTTSLRKDGVALSSSSEKYFFTTNPFQYVASVDGKVGNYTEVTTVTPIPQTATVGDGGAIHVANIYENNAKIGTSTGTWELKSSNGTNALLCTLVSEKYLIDSKNLTEEDCFEIDSAGNPTGKLTASIAKNGTVITFK